MADVAWRIFPPTQGRAHAYQGQSTSAACGLALHPGAIFMRNSDRCSRCLRALGQAPRRLTAEARWDGREMEIDCPAGPLPGSPGAYDTQGRAMGRELARGLLPHLNALADEVKRLGWDVESIRFQVSTPSWTPEET